jgi:antitoxin VapB
MSEEFNAKIFKSGNSLALRLPKALGLKEGQEMRLREERGRFVFEPVDAIRKIDVSGFWGKAPWLRPIKPEDRVFEERELDWEGRRLKRDG